MRRERRKLTMYLSGALASLAFLLPSCENGEGPAADTWDRGAMLEHLTDDFIVPAFENYKSQTADLVAAATWFEDFTDQQSLDRLREELEDAYLAWQWVSFLEIGPGEAKALRFRSNTFPTDTANLKGDITSFAAGSGPNFQLPSTFDRQGYPALDFLVEGKDLDYFISNPDAAAYVSNLAISLHTLAVDVDAAWENERIGFIANNGSAASASTNKLANDYVFHYEKEFRAGKVGIPAGVFSSVPLPEKVESLYGGYSRKLFLEALKAHRAFFFGKSYDGLSEGPGFAAYLDHLNVRGVDGLLSEEMQEVFTESENLALELNENFEVQISDDHIKALELYDAVQRGVVILKVDMMQALNIKVDYIDADGD